MILCVCVCFSRSFAELLLISQISIILPDTKAIPDTILPFLKDTDHYQIADLPLTELIKKPFIEAFIKKG